MKIGLCVNMFGTEADRTGAYLIPLAAELGFDYVELPLAQIMELDNAAFAVVLDILKSAGIPCESCNNFFPASVRLTGEQRDEKITEDYIARALLRASRLGAKVIVFGSAPAKNVPEGFPQDKAFGQITDTLRTAAGLAAEYGINIAIEPLNRLEANITLNLCDAEKLMLAVDKPNVKALFDYYHFALEQDSVTLLSRLCREGNIAHAHFAEPKGRVIPAEKRPDYAEVLNALKQNCYSGRLSIEALCRNADNIKDELRIGLAVLRGICA